MRKIFALLFALLFILTGCNGRGSAVPENSTELENAKFLRLQSHPGYTVAEIMNPGDTLTMLQRLILVPRGEAVPDSLPEGVVIRTPLQKVVIYSSVHEKGISLAGNPEAIVGVTDAAFFSSERIRKGLADGSIADLGAPQSPSAEKILDAAPDAILLNVYDNIDLRQVDRLGIPIIKLTDSYETSPLGRAEWIKLYGELFGRRPAADSIYTYVRGTYDAIRQKASAASSKPRVMTDNMYQGVWYVPGGKSYQAQMLHDAGAKYIFSDDATTGSIPLSFEKVLERGADADMWLIKSFGTDLTRDALLSQDKRYRAFSAVDNGGVYYCNTLTHPVFDDTAFLPHLLLADYAAMFHPELFGNKPLRYYARMKQ